MLQEAAVSVVGLVFVVVGLVKMNDGRRERARGGRIAETETTRIGDLDPGTVEVKGTARPSDDGATLEAPFSGTDAVAVHVTVEQWESSSQGGGTWETIFEEETAEPMVVDDGTGEVLVELPSGGGLSLEETETQVDSDDEPPDAIRRYVEDETDVDVPERREVGPLSVGERRRYHEGVLEPGAEVYLLGAVRETAAGWDRLDYVIDEPTESGDFVLSNQSEAALIEERRRGGLVPLAFGALLTVVGAGTALVPWISLS